MRVGAVNIQAILCWIIGHKYAPWQDGGHAKICEKCGDINFHFRRES
jgi:hypothetical protein